ncbi:MAG: peptidoglycan DD-metalloendopeptidase family protein, partial [Candidatus Omnitrophica bacterium]|nr:peptidoglycan DD-metalloendopeptidase family protein [Candidatus Omnitrophota bacterium]
YQIGRTTAQAETPAVTGTEVAPGQTNLSLLGSGETEDTAELESEERLAALDGADTISIWTYETHGLRFYTMRDLAGRPGTDNAWVNGDAAVRADILGQAFFEITGKRVGVNRQDDAPGTAGIRRGTRIDTDNPGVQHSMHLHGKAFDFQMEGLTTEERALFLELGLRVGFRGVGFYGAADGDFVHMDLGRVRTWTGNDTPSQPTWATEVMASYHGAAGTLTDDATRQALVTHLAQALASRVPELPGRKPTLIGGPDVGDTTGVETPAVETTRTVTPTDGVAPVVERTTGGDDETEETGEVFVTQRPIAELRAELLASSVIRNDGLGDGHYGASRNHGSHTGIDIAGPMNGQITAPWSGTVVTAETQNGYGKVVEIQTQINGTTLNIFYAHLSSIEVSVGDTVSRRDVIGTIGRTGNAGGTDPHTHVEIEVNGSRIDPTNIIARAYDRVPLKNSGLSGLMTLGSMSLLDVARERGIDEAVVLARPDVLASDQYSSAAYKPVTEPFVSRLEPQLLASVRATYDADAAVVNRHFGNFDNFVRFVENIIMAESSFDHSQVSGDGAVGYMQLMLAAYTDARNAIGTDWGPDDRTDPVKNVRAGT